MPQEKQLVLQLHELLAYLNQQGVLTLLVNPQHGVVGSLQTSLDLSYLADTVMLLRFFEAEGRIRKALSIIKNRGGPHEDRIRPYRIDTGRTCLSSSSPVAGRQHAACLPSCICQRCSGMSSFWSGPSTPWA